MQIWDINEIIEEESIEIYFQPIISTYKGKVAGLEALVRGIDKNTQNIISPMELFDAARMASKVYELDSLCQRKAIQKFGEKFNKIEDLILFINIDNTVIHLYTDDSILKYATEYGVSPKNIVLEINELQSDDILGMSSIKDFANKHRKMGFMISIDDIGAGFSNLDRIIAMKPDIIKIDRALIKGIYKQYYKQQVVDMIIKLGEKTGALIVAEGVEELEEILTVLQYGAHLLQGFYISKPKDLRLDEIYELNQKVSEVSQEQTNYLNDFLVEKCYSNAKLRQEFEEIKIRLETNAYNNREDFLKDILYEYPHIECSYIIDISGIQVTNTIFNEKLTRLHKKTLFSPFKKGDNAKLKAYYYVLKTTNQDLYISDEYLSLATGSKCITISGYYKQNDKKQILCYDIVM